MKTLLLTIIAVAFASTGLAQNDRGTITGTISDPAGAVVPNASLKVTNTQTGAVFETTATETGNYTIPQLPLGEYTLSAEAAGFTKFIQQGIRVFASETLRIDVALQVGATNESVTVQADASMLKTESAEQSSTLNEEKLDQLPLNFGALGNSASANIRNPYTFVTLVPSATISSYSTIALNGIPSNTFRMNLEGQEANNARNIGRQDQMEPSVESLQEVSVQSSNFSAEFGQVGGGYFNLVVKSGTNDLHGSLFEYFVNEDLGAGQPFTNNGNGQLLRPPNRRNDFGGSIGGPVYIPHVYNGRNRTFFFFSFEEFLQTQTTTTLNTVPTVAMRNGDFSGALTGKVLGTDPLGRSILENTIYDPASFQTVNGQVVTNPFPNDVIPLSRMDPVALKVQSLIPQPEFPGIINNWQENVVASTTENIPTIKVDQSLPGLAKLSFYWSRYWGPHNQYGDGLPTPITGMHRIFSQANTYRANYDQPVTPRFLLHAGIGVIRLISPDKPLPASLSYNSITQLGLNGALENGFPDFIGLSTANGGGMALNMGGGGAIQTYYKPTAVLSGTLVRDNHTFKAGGEWRIDALSVLNIGGLNQGSTGGGLTAVLGSVYPSPFGTYAFSNAQTGLPYTQGQTIGGGNVGLPYASFMLGAVNTAAITNPADTQARKPSWSLYIQDNWKITHKLTLDYGLRWDYQGYPQEIFDRSSEFSPTTANPSTDGLPGAITYEGNGPGTCNCNFTHPTLTRSARGSGWRIRCCQGAYCGQAGVSLTPRQPWARLRFCRP